MTDNIKKLIEANKCKQIQYIPHGVDVLASGGVAYSVCSGKDEWRESASEYIVNTDFRNDDGSFFVNDYFYVKPTHFRHLPDDRLAHICEVLLDKLNTIHTWCDGNIASKVITASYSRQIRDSIDDALSRANEIAGGTK